MPAPALFALPAMLPGVAASSLGCACARLRSLAQQSGESILPVFGWSLVLILLLVGGFYAISRLRQWLREDGAPAGPAIGFTLSDLRQLHRQGKMTDEEFERARSRIVGSAKAMASTLPDPLAGSRARAPARDRDREEARGDASPSAAAPADEPGPPIPPTGPTGPTGPTDVPPQRRL